MHNLLIHSPDRDTPWPWQLPWQAGQDMHYPALRPAHLPEHHLTPFHAHRLPRCLPHRWRHPPQMLSAQQHNRIEDSTGRVRTRYMSAHLSLSIFKQILEMEIISCGVKGQAWWICMILNGIIARLLCQLRPIQLGGSSSYLVALEQSRVSNASS